MCPINDTFVSAGEDGTVRLWDLRTPNTVGLLHSEGGTTLAAIDSSGEVMAVVCSTSRVIALYSVKEMDKGSFHTADLQDPWLETISQPPPELVFTSVSFNNNGSLILLGTSSDVHFVLDGFDCRVVRRLVGHRGFEYDRQTGTKDVQPRRGTSGEEVGWTADSRWVISGSSTARSVCGTWPSRRGWRSTRRPTCGRRPGPMSCFRRVRRRLGVSRRTRGTPCWLSVAMSCPSGCQHVKTARTLYPKDGRSTAHQQGPEPQPGPQVDHCITAQPRVLHRPASNLYMWAITLFGRPV